jgi:UDP-N-acetylmuramate dehydrogenase
MGRQAIEMNAWSDWNAESEARGELRYREPMSRHSSWRCGGLADRYFEPADREDLIAFLRSIPGAEPIYWIGLGSNMLIRDGGLRGTVIATTPGLGQLHWLDASRLYAECGVTCARLAREAVTKNLAGIEFLAGIPGTLGGALAMNAGALGGEVWDYVESVETVDRQGCIRRRARDEYEADYRQVRGPEGEWFVAGVLRMTRPAGGRGSETIKAVLAQRSATQPTGKATCGSVFKNPPDDFAGRLIEQCGLKGYRIGGCSISAVHANFIENDRGASAEDLEKLIAYVQATVESATGVRLEPEVRIVGQAGDTDPREGRGQ